VRWRLRIVVETALCVTLAFLSAERNYFASV
jgi:hypothetical protein